MAEEFVKEKSNKLGIELNFDGEQPGAVDYFQMAMKESENLKNSLKELENKNDDDDKDNDDIDKNALVQQLFEKAISAFETEWKESQEKEDIKHQKDLLVQYMDCLKEFSLWTKYIGSIEDAENLCEEWLKKNDSEGYIWIILANLRLIKMNINCENENDAEQLDDDDEDEEEEEEEEEEEGEGDENGKGKGKAGEQKSKKFVDNKLPEKDKKELDNIKNSLEKGFSLLENEKEQDKKLISELNAIIANTYYNYSLCQRQSSSKRQCVACIKECLEYTIGYSKKAVELNPSDYEKDDWLQALPGFAYYYLADLYSEKYEDLEKAMDYVMEAIDIVMSAEALAKKENKLMDRAKYLEMIGQSYLLLSTMTDSDDDTLGAYENAIDAMKASIKLNPDNQNLLNLMVEIGALILNEDGTYVLPEGHDHDHDHEFEEIDGDEDAPGCCGGCCGCCCGGGGCCGGAEEDEEAEDEEAEDENVDDTKGKRKSEHEENPAKFIKTNDGEKCCGGGCCQNK